MSRVLLSAHHAVWGVPMLLLILGVGIRLGFQTGFVQLRLFPQAVRKLCELISKKSSRGETTSFRALCTALGATVGTGNIVGVAGAICLGGPGVVFWMWICGFWAMGIKYAEATLAVQYRNRDGSGYTGGPMYMFANGLPAKWKPLALAYSLFGLLASFGVGNTAQINAVVSGIGSVLSAQGKEITVQQKLAIGLILSVFLGSILMGGTKRIGAAAEYLVPFAAVGYIVLCSAVLVLRWDRISGAVFRIISGAFSPKAVTCGVVGSCFQAMKIGCCRGVFTNEAGMGTASMAHASADVCHPVEQGLMGIVEVFLDTIVLCTLTALVILVSDIVIPYGSDHGGLLTASAFASVCGEWTSMALSAAICCFAVATVLGWSVYGSCCANYLFGRKAMGAFAAAQTVTVVIGAVLETETIWLVSELLNGFMVVPNLITLAVLSRDLRCLTIEYINKRGGFSAEGGYHADFNQRKPVRAVSYEKVSSLRSCSGKGRKEDLPSEYRSA